MGCGIGTNGTTDDSGATSSVDSGIAAELTIGTVGSTAFFWNGPTFSMGDCSSELGSGFLRGLGCCATDSAEDGCSDGRTKSSPNLGERRVAASHPTPALANIANKMAAAARSQYADVQGVVGARESCSERDFCRTTDVPFRWPARRGAVATGGDTGLPFLFGSAASSRRYLGDLPWFPTGNGSELGARANRRDCNEAEPSAGGATATKLARLSSSANCAGVFQQLCSTRAVAAVSSDPSRKAPKSSTETASTDAASRDGAWSIAPPAGRLDSNA